MRRILASLAIMATIVAGLVVANAPTAQAATSPSTACSSVGPDGTWQTLSSHALSDVGRVYLMYKNGYNCVTVIKYKAVGTATYVEARLGIEGSRQKTDSGNYKYYAAVAQYAPNDCVWWWSGEMFTNGSGSGYWESGRISAYCG
ncbi:MAG: hypothetical protein HOQ05_12940 [Corynebacteriales bacterium]|nr:hypothetical protein [Mycobacteriales bacterium]